jgi:hypothetical protein
MLSLLDDVAVGPVDAFLNAADTVMNGNTLLLKARMDEQVSDDNRARVLEGFIKGPLFEDMIRRAYRQRGWGDMDEGSPVIDGGTLEVRDMSQAQFTQRLRWMLTEAFSPYNHHCGAQHAGELSDDVHEWLQAQLPHNPTQQRSWSYADVAPTFLRRTGYYDHLPHPHEAAFFDGSASDTATLIYEGDVLLLLLTNGSP